MTAQSNAAQPIRVSRKAGVLYILQIAVLCWVVCYLYSRHRALAYDVEVLHKELAELKAKQAGMADDLASISKLNSSVIWPKREMKDSVGTYWRLTDDEANHWYHQQDLSEYNPCTAVSVNQEQRDILHLMKDAHHRYTITPTKADVTWMTSDETTLEAEIKMSRSIYEREVFDLVHQGLLTPVPTIDGDRWYLTSKARGCLTSEGW
jgi:hypothetical protein